jgi:uncharacterized membrane protein YhiD involved in acid resistance
VFTSFQSADLFPISGMDICLNIVVALICGLCIAWLYRHTYKGPGYSISFVNSIVLLTMITALVIMTIGNSVARAFGLVGAMSIVRFRTAVKDTQDIVYIFFALAIGMAAGVGYHKVAFLGTGFVGVIIYLFSKTRVYSPEKEEYLLQFSYSPNGDDVPAYIPLLTKYCRRHQTINTRSVGADGETLEVSYYVRLKEERRNSDFVRDLRRSKGVNQVNLYSDEQQF